MELRQLTVFGLLHDDNEHAIAVLERQIRLRQLSALALLFDGVPMVVLNAYKASVLLYDVTSTRTDASRALVQTMLGMLVIGMKLQRCIQIPQLAQDRDKLLLRQYHKRAEAAAAAKSASPLRHSIQKDVHPDQIEMSAMGEHSKAVVVERSDSISADLAAYASSNQDGRARSISVVVIPGENTSTPAVVSDLAPIVEDPIASDGTTTSQRLADDLVHSDDYEAP